MKGHILSYDKENGTGVISGHDGKRYRFTKNDWQSDKTPKPEQQVDFVIEGEGAKEIVLLKKAADSQKDSKTIAAWAFGVIFGIAGLSALFTSGGFVAGLSFLLIAAILLPPAQDFIQEKTGKTFSKGAKIGAVIFLLFIAGSFAPESYETSHTTPAANNVTPEAQAKTEKATQAPPKENSELKELAAKCPESNSELLPIVQSPDGFYNLIRNSAEQMTDLRLKEHFKEIKGKAVVWSGWIEEVKEKLLGGYEVTIDMDNPNEPASVQEIYFELDKDDAYKLEKDDLACFVGIIDSVVTVLGKPQVDLVEAQVIKTYDWVAPVHIRSRPYR